MIIPLFILGTRFGPTASRGNFAVGSKLSTLGQLVVDVGQPNHCGLRFNVIRRARQHPHFGCAITQTQSGKRVESKAVGATPEEALRGGLDELRQALGW